MTYIEKLCKIRAREPDRIAKALADRPGARLADQSRLMVIACDHPARAALGAGDSPMAMASREELLNRCMRALSRPGVNGFLGTADLIEDLTLLGALDGKVVWGSMNRGGLQGATFEIDDRFTCYDVQGIHESALDGGKMLLRIDFHDENSPRTMEAASHAINQLAENSLCAMVEPFIAKSENGHFVNDLSTDAVIRSVAVASGLGRTSAYTWLKLPCVDNMEAVMESTSLPSLILGGEVSKDPAAARASWGRALALPNVRGLVVGRSLLYPPDGNVEAAVDQAVELL